MKFEQGEVYDDITDFDWWVVFENILDSDDTMRWEARNNITGTLVDGQKETVCTHNPLAPPPPPIVAQRYYEGGKDIGSGGDWAAKVVAATDNNAEGVFFYGTWSTAPDAIPTVDPHYFCYWDVYPFRAYLKWTLDRSSDYLATDTEDEVYSIYIEKGGVYPCEH